MIIIYGKKRKPLSKMSAGIVQCPHCLQAAQVIAVACVNYFYIYWIPLFGWKSPVYFCSICQKSLLPARARGSRYKNDLIVSIPAEAQAAYQMLAPQARIPWYYFSGLILMALAIVFVLGRNSA
jgi:hypothetical protein